MNATEDPHEQPQLAAATPAEEAPAAVNAVKGVAIGCAAMVAVPLVIFLVYVITFMAQRSAPEDYPTVRPEQAAERIADRAQEMYEVAGFERRLPEGEEDGRFGSEPVNTLEADFCYPDGLESMADEAEDGAYSLHHEWSVPDVRKDRALATLRRLREHLKNEGWTITEYGHNKLDDDWELAAEKGEDQGVSFTWYPEVEHFSGRTGSACAYDPDWTESEDALPGSYLTARPLHPAA
ncbi:hypothetical protein [Streptomyces cavernicola]|uniref:Uncharacterized protein n=1 Tax=Streptomyces cavernicola TaxID=3043613 RepID=A0ABT6SPI3_9ACTN|nr:hypothetical protein [Streptomyces sp. B-S-A6]MDI3409343.1 hypothetical protein [Streptomyces sp. B-S-A6]